MEKICNQTALNDRNHVIARDLSRSNPSSVIGRNGVTPLAASEAWRKPEFISLDCISASSMTTSQARNDVMQQSEVHPYVVFCKMHHFFISFSLIVFIFAAMLSVFKLKQRRWNKGDF
jgi:hypothetical protein